MYRVIFSIEFHEFRFKIMTDVRKHAFQFIKNFFREDPATIFCDEDQMHMHLKNAVSSHLMPLSFFIDWSILHGMKRLQAFRFELMPNGEQQRNMRRFAGSCRFVYNKALALQKENYDAKNKFI